ncbi:Hypothetical protein, putative [Bodo saltans]|uniref:Uncharacterized protein n=1 Tax=Bodo saltans TaxID=75058 RepID=A0A0S4JHV8_BODSA|nr:Hypothetical protein, putative [Bodo saltans]|eukprot:CUG91101.1 Hypothetical protein, putative [Bodo saltans]
MKDFATCGALRVFLPSQKEVVVASPQPPQFFVSSATLPPPPPTSRAENSAIVRSQQPVTKDGSRLLTIDVRKLPAVPTSGGPVAKKQFATNLIRYLLYVLEEVRFHSLDGIGVLPTTTTGADGGEALSAGSKPIEPFESEQPRRESGSVATTATVAPTGPTKKTKTKKMLGASATRRIGAIGTSTEDCYTILIDVSALSALTVVLSEGEELLCQAYPLSIVRVVVHQGLIVSHSASTSSSELPTASTDVAMKSPPMTAKKAPVLSVFTSLFKSKSTTTKSGTAAAGDAKTSAPPPLSTPSFASKVWLSVSFSTWKLRFLHHTVRSRTVLADKLDPFVHVDALLLSLQ